MRYQLFIKHFLNKSTPEEIRIINSWKNSKAENSAIYDSLKRHWNEGRFLDHYKLFRKASLKQPFDLSN